MCLGASSPSPPPPPPPPPEPAKTTDPSVTKAKQTERSKAARAAGRQSTLLGGELVGAPENQTAKTLLGQ